MILENNLGVMFRLIWEDGKNKIDELSTVPLFIGRSQTIRARSQIILAEAPAYSQLIRAGERACSAGTTVYVCKLLQLATRVGGHREVKPHLAAWGELVNVARHFPVGG